MRKYFTSLFGNDETKNRIGSNIENGTLPHAYIIEGADGSGKTFFAYLIAAALSCEKKNSKNEALPCMSCDTCRKILDKNYPDVYFLDKGERASIPIEAIREMRSDMFLSAAESQYKVYIVNDAHLMLPPSQNALLKVLEEPPKNVIILLLCNTSDTILGTIKSRTQTIRMSLFSNDDIQRFVLENDKNAQVLYARSKEEFSAVIVNAAGRIGNAIDLLDPKQSAFIQKQRACIDGIIKTVVEKSSFLQAHKAFSLLSQKRNELSSELEILHSAIRDLILIKKDENAPLVYYFDREEASAIASKIGIQRLFNISDSIVSAIQDLSINANVGIVFNSLINEFKK